VSFEKLTIEWVQFDNFFSLWRSHRNSTRLLYVIGDDHHCYIGSIGSRDGKLGLGMRYQWQYVSRARAIFGLDESSGQVAFAGVLRKNNGEVVGLDILAAEAGIQSDFMSVHGPDRALFDPEDLVPGYAFLHSGSPPKFLRKG